MKILHLSAVKNWGGGENHIENLCRELEDNPEVQNYILCTRNGLFHSRLKNSTLAFFTAPLYIKLDPAYIGRIGAICKKQKIDLIHIHDTTALSLAVMADYFYQLPPFVFSKKTSFPIKDRKQTLYKYNYPKIKRILCVSEETRRITNNSIKDNTKLKVIYHGTRIDNKTSITPFSLHKKLDIPPTHYIIGNIANHIRAKHIETLIEIANELVNKLKRKDLVFVQMGNFTKRTPALQKKVQELNLQSNLKFMGFIPDASNYIPQFDISLITSQSEGVPQVIYESFYHTVPIISTRTGGIPEVITHQENGLLADVHDSQQLAQHILSLINNKDLKEKFTGISRTILMDKYTTEIMAQRTLAEYKSIIYGRNSD